MKTFIKISNLISIVLYFIFATIYYSTYNNLIILSIATLLFQIFSTIISISYQKRKFNIIKNYLILFFVAISTLIIYIILINFDFEINTKQRLFVILDFPILYLSIMIFQKFKKIE